MKKKFLLASMMLLAFAANGQQMKNNAVKVNPLSLIVRTGNLSYERATTNSQSFQLGCFYSGLSLGNLEYNGFGLTPEYRFYFGGLQQALDGAYVAPFVRYQQFSLTNKEENSKGKFSAYGSGAVIGWEKSFRGGFMLDLFAGPSYSLVKFRAGNADDFDIKGGMKGFGLRTGIVLGVSF